MNNIPKETLKIIIDHLDISSLYSLSWVCKLYSSFRDKLVDYGKHSNFAVRDISCDTCVEDGNLELFKWFLDNNHISDQDSCILAAQYGHIHILDYMKKNDLFHDRALILCAVEFGHLETMIWLWDNGCSLEGNEYEYAAKLGRLDILSWLKSNECYCYKNIAIISARNGNLNILKWAKKHGDEYDFTRDVWYSAAAGGHLNILQWLDKNFPECGEQVKIFEVPFNKITKENYDRVIKYLRKNGYTM